MISTRFHPEEARAPARPSTPNFDPKIATRYKNMA